MTQKNQSKKESDLAERIGELQEKREEIEKEIKAWEKSRRKKRTMGRG